MSVGSGTRTVSVPISTMLKQTNKKWMTFHEFAVLGKIHSSEWKNWRTSTVDLMRTQWESVCSDSQPLITIFKRICFDTMQFRYCSNCFATSAWLLLIVNVQMAERISSYTSISKPIQGDRDMTTNIIMQFFYFSIPSCSWGNLNSAHLARTTQIDLLICSDTILLQFFSVFRDKLFQIRIAAKLFIERTYYANWRENINLAPLRVQIDQMDGSHA